MFDLAYLVGLKVGQISFGSGVTLELWNTAGASDDRAKLEAGPVRYQSPSGSVIELDLTEQTAMRYAPLLALYGCEITAARADEKLNTLELVFEAGDTFTALPMRKVEGWQLAGPGNRFVVAVPGGEVAVWE